jgi:hypothetical protein
VTSSTRFSPSTCTPFVSGSGYFIATCSGTTWTITDYTDAACLTKASLPVLSGTNAVCSVITGGSILVDCNVAAFVSQPISILIALIACVIAVGTL